MSHSHRSLRADPKRTENGHSQSAGGSSEWARVRKRAGASAWRSHPSAVCECWKRNAMQCGRIGRQRAEAERTGKRGRGIADAAQRSGRVSQPAAARQRQQGHSQQRSDTLRTLHSGCDALHCTHIGLSPRMAETKKRKKKGKTNRPDVDH